MGYPTAGAVTGVECHKQVRSWRLLRSLMQLLIPTCNSTFLEQHHHDQYINPEAEHRSYNPSSMITTTLSSLSSSVISGTIFGYRHGRANLCIQEKPSSSTPLLLLQLPIPTTVLAKQMRGGTLRMVLQRASINPRSCCCCSRVLLTPLWTLYCNGKKQGYAVKRRPEDVDMEVLRLMGKVVAGAGIMRGKKKKKKKKEMRRRRKLDGEEEEDDDDHDHEVLYLRANFRRVRSESDNCESFHLIDPEGSSIGEELSVFFFG